MTSLLILLILVHWVADFVFQTDKMATSKSSSNTWLLIHVGIYAMFLLPFGPVFALVNFCAHLATDFVSSRATSHLWKKNDRHNFFVVIGLDQAAHLIVLILTIPLMGWDIAQLVGL